MGHEERDRSSSLGWPATVLGPGPGAAGLLPGWRFLVPLPLGAGLCTDTGGGSERPWFELLGGREEMAELGRVWRKSCRGSQSKRRTVGLEGEGREEEKQHAGRSGGCPGPLCRSRRVHLLTGCRLPAATPAFRARTGLSLSCVTVPSRTAMHSVTATGQSPGVQDEH